MVYLLPSLQVPLLPDIIDMVQSRYMEYTLRAILSWARLLISNAHCMVPVLVLDMPSITDLQSVLSVVICRSSPGAGAAAA
jgi:hypothetical protein